MRSRYRPTPEIQNDSRQTGSAYISCSTTDRHAVLTAIPGFSGSPDSTESASTSVDVDRYWKRKMATAKPEVVISHVRQQIDTRFKWLDPGFVVTRLDGDIAVIRRRRPTPETQDGDRQTGSSYISRSATHTHAVPKALPTLMVSPDSTHYA
jgi:hypothetical protein